MTTPALLDFVRAELQKGTSREGISAMLLGEGWSLLDVNQAIATVAGTPPLQTPATSAPIAQQPAPYQPQPSQQQDPQQPAQFVRPPSISAMRPRRKNHIVAIIIIIIVLACLGAAGVYGYHTYFAPAAGTGSINNSPAI